MKLQTAGGGEISVVCCRRYGGFSPALYVVL